MKTLRVPNHKGLVTRLALVLVFVAAAWPSWAAPGAPEAVNIELLGDQSGPYAVALGPMAAGAQDAAEYVNKEMGGVNGVKINVVVKDTQGIPTLGVKLFTELAGAAAKPLFALAPISPLAEHLRSLAAEAGVILLTPGAASNIYPPANSYSWFPLYVSQAGALVKWVKDNWKESRSPRIAILTWDTAYGKAIIAPEFFDYCKEIGVEIVAEELFKVSDKDLVTHLVRIRAKNPDWILTNTLGPGPAAIMKAVKELGMDVKLLNTVGGDWATLSLGGPELFDGSVVTLAAASYDDETHPGVKRLNEYRKARGRGDKEKTMTYVLGWNSVLLVHKTMTDAIAKVGWDKLDAAAIRKELNGLTDWQPLDGIMRITYTDKSRATPWVIIYRALGGKLVPAGGVGGDGSFVLAPDLTPKQFR